MVILTDYVSSEDKLDVEIDVNLAFAQDKWGLFGNEVGSSVQ
jgi:hypothetical protein